MKTRKYSRQRESIKSCLAGRCDHPTADALYASIREEFPNISLGTVYRNLNLLVELVIPHYHFFCTCCHQVSDLSMGPFEEMNALAQRYHEGMIQGHATTFYGICPACCKKDEGLQQ